MSSAVPSATASCAASRSYRQPLSIIDVSCLTRLSQVSRVMCTSPLWRAATRFARRRDDHRGRFKSASQLDLRSMDDGILVGDVSYWQRVTSHHLRQRSGCKQTANELGNTRSQPTPSNGFLAPTAQSLTWVFATERLASPRNSTSALRLLSGRSQVRLLPGAHFSRAKPIARFARVITTLS